MSHITFYDNDSEVVIDARLPEVKKIIERRSIGTTQSENSRWRHLTYYDMPVYPMDSRYHMGRVGTGGIHTNGQLNLSFFRATTLDEGIEITLAGGNWNDSEWRRVREVVAKSIKDLVRRHYAPKVNYSLSKDGREIEDEEDTLVQVSQNITQPSEMSHKLTLAVGKELEDDVSGWKVKHIPDGLNYHTYEAA